MEPIDEKMIICFLRDIGFAGLINISPNIEELLVPYNSAMVEINYKFGTSFNEEQVRKILRNYGISRHTEKEFLNIKKQAKTPLKSRGPYQSTLPLV